MAAGNDRVITDVTKIELTRTGGPHTVTLADSTTVFSGGYVQVQATSDSVKMVQCICFRDGHVGGYAGLRPTESPQTLFRRLTAEFSTSDLLRLVQPTPDPRASSQPTYTITIFEGKTSKSFAAERSPGVRLSAQDSQIVAEFMRLLDILEKHMITWIVS